MDAMTRPRPDGVQALDYSGTAGSYLGLALVNLLLTIVTLGIYRFWAKTQVRRHLWERTSFQGEPLEYRGRGLEKLLGALIVFAGLIVPLAVAGILAGMFAAAGEPLLVGAVYVPIYFGIFYLVGVAVYRSQRYLFSRTSWRGIRGGMIKGGWSYGWLNFKMMLLQAVTLGFASPYTTVRLWNARMNDSMFGSLPVVAAAEWRPLFNRFLMAWVGVLAIYVGVLAFLFTGMPEVMAAVGRPGAPPPTDPGAAFAAFTKLYGVLLLGGLAAAMLTLGYQAALLREVFDKTRIGPVGLRISVTAGDLLGFYLGNVALIVFTLGLGLIMMPYRTWTFYVRRLATLGIFDAEDVLQSRLDAPTQGDGLADAFDLSAV